jgi:hypothetical protein
LKPRAVRKTHLPADLRSRVNDVEGGTNNLGC